MNKIIDRTLFFRWGESSTCLEVSGDVFFLILTEICAA